MKRCNRCEQFKSLTEFYKKSNSSEPRYRCKPCHTRKNPLIKERAGAKRKLSDDQRRVNCLLKYKKYRSKPGYKAIHAEQSARRRATKLNATPKWLSKHQLEHIKAYYETAAVLSKEWGVQMDVDHIIPLMGKNVCGLHVPWNLQVMIHVANREKSNRVQNEQV